MTDDPKEKRSQSLTKRPAAPPRPPKRKRTKVVLAAARPPKPAKTSPAPGAGAERRVHPRFDLIAQITVRHAKLTHIMTIRDLSRSGVRMEATVGDTPRWVREGQQRVEIGIFLENHDAVLNLSGSIVHVIPGNEQEPARFGVHFDTPSEAAAALLDKVLAESEKGRMALAPPPIPRDA